jgi:predicted dehydrogenase
MLWASQVAPGHENGLRLRVYGTKGGIEWVQAEPNALLHSPVGAPRQWVTRGSAAAGPAAARVTRIPSGHPEGYLEGFATCLQPTSQRRSVQSMQANRFQARLTFPGIADGVILEWPSSKRR